MQAYEGAEKAHKRMCRMPMELVSRPELFSGDLTPLVMALLADFDTIYKKMRDELKMRTLLAGNLVEGLTGDRNSPPDTTRAPNAAANNSRGSLAHMAVRQGNGWLLNNRWYGAPPDTPIDGICPAAFAPPGTRDKYCPNSDPNCDHNLPGHIQLINGQGGAQKPAPKQQIGDLMKLDRWSHQGTPKPKQNAPKPARKPSRSLPAPNADPQPAWKRSRQPPVRNIPPGWPPMANHHLNPLASPIGAGKPSGSGKGSGSFRSGGRGKGKNRPSPSPLGKGKGTGKGSKEERSQAPWPRPLAPMPMPYPRQRN